MGDWQGKRLRRPPRRDQCKSGDLTAASVGRGDMAPPRRARMKHILAIIVLIALVIASWSIRLQNPTLTETQLLIEYWPLWLAIVAVALITAWWYRHE